MPQQSGLKEGHKGERMGQTGASGEIPRELMMETLVM
jgi:hypothetical protein